MLLTILEINNIFNIYIKSDCHSVGVIDGPTVGKRDGFADGPTEDGEVGFREGFPEGGVVGFIEGAVEGEAV